MAPPSELPPFNVSGATVLGSSLYFQPDIIFNQPVKLIISTPEFSDIDNLSDVSFYLYRGGEWVLASDRSGNSLISGWMVPKSRVIGDDRIEIKVYHVSGIQSALVGEGAGGGAGISIPPIDDVGSCFIGNLLSSTAGWVYGISFLTIVLIAGGAVLLVVKRKKLICVRKE